MKKTSRSATLAISESYIIGVDKYEDDEFTITVVTQNGNHLEYVNTITGKDAEELYEKLTNKSLERGNKNEQVTNIASCRI